MQLLALPRCLDVSLCCCLITDNACAYYRNEILHIIKIEDSYIRNDVRQIYIYINIMT